MGGVPFRTPSKPVYSKDIQHGHLYVHWRNWGDEASAHERDDLPELDMEAQATMFSTKSTSEDEPDRCSIAFEEGSLMGGVLLGIEACAPLKKDLMGGVHGADCT